MGLQLNRRRFLGITASLALAGPALATERDLHVWNGTALGARASLRLYHPERGAAEAVLERCSAEIDRLDRIFSLYRWDSALSRLNEAGEFLDPPLDLIRLLGDAGRFNRITGGVFDVTVQPLWRLYATHFSEAGRESSGPHPEAVAGALDLVGQEKLSVGPDRITFARSGMGLTLNGIAQGYITDRVTDLLRQEEFADILVDLGEARASGRHTDERPWRAALTDPRTGRPMQEVDLRDRALATSAPSGFMFDAAGRFSHIFDPRRGRAATTHPSVSVLAPDATTADALSTAFVQMPVDEIRHVLEATRGVEIYLLHADARLEQITSAKG